MNRDGASLSGAGVQGRARPNRLGVGLALGAALTAFGCAHVAPYDRERLADPTMQLGDMSGAAEGHVHAVHEGAAGGSVAASSGCGCN